MSVLKTAVIGGTLAVGAVIGTLGTSAPTQAGVCVSDYEIQHGDTLLEIARDQLGTVFSVQFIIDANRGVIGHNPDLIYPGDRLMIPCERAMGGAIDWSVMPDGATLANLLARAEVQVLDIRENDQVANGVIPGSIHVPFSVFQAFAEPTTSRPSAEDLSDIVGFSGIRLNEPLIIVSNRATVDELEKAAEIYALLRDVGGKHIAILNGGYRGWVNMNLPVVAFPSLPDPYEISLEYDDLISSDKEELFDDVINDQRSGFWQDVAPQPDKIEFSFKDIIFARFAGD